MNNNLIRWAISVNVLFNLVSTRDESFKDSIPSTKDREADHSMSKAGTAITLMLPLPQMKSCTKEQFEANYPCGRHDFVELQDYKTCVKVSPRRTHNWTQANDSCSSFYYGHLVIIPDNEFDLALDSVGAGAGAGAGGNTATSNQEVWIGLTRSDNKTNFTWLNGTELDKTIYRKWPEKDQIQDDNHCVGKMLDDGKWAVKRCDQRLGFICQRFNDRTLLPPRWDLFKTAAVEGCVIQANCSGFLAEDAALGFGFQSKMGYQAILPDDIRATVVEEKYVFDSWRCRRHGRSSLALDATMELNGTELQCCTLRTTGNTPQEECSPSPPISVRPSPHTRVPIMPRLRVTMPSTELQEGDIIQAVCLAVLTHNAEIMFVIFSDASTSYITTKDGQVTYLKGLTRVSHDKCVKRWVHATLNLKVRGSMNNKRLACISGVNPAGSICTGNDPYCTVAAGRIKVGGASGFSWFNLWDFWELLRGLDLLSLVLLLTGVFCSLLTCLLCVRLLSPRRDPGEQIMLCAHEGEDVIPRPEALAQTTTEVLVTEPDPAARGSDPKPDEVHANDATGSRGSTEKDTLRSSGPRATSSRKTSTASKRKSEPASHLGNTKPETEM